MPKAYLGVDGCRGGWFVIQLTGTGVWRTALVPTAEALAGLINKSKLTLIDIPTGLLDCGGPQRDCDQQARKALGMPRAASVFSVPCRSAVYANSYLQACRLNHSMLGKKLSKQAWNITAKIRQIDELLQNEKHLQNKLRECHPEVCFWALNNKNAMQFNKKQSMGREERLSVLSRYLPSSRKILEFAASEYSRKEVAADDVIDAMAMAVTAMHGHKKLNRFPDQTQLDNRGIRMEITYWYPSSQTAFLIKNHQKARTNQIQSY